MNKIIDGKYDPYFSISTNIDKLETKLFNENYDEDL